MQTIVRAKELDTASTYTSSCVCPLVNRFRHVRGTSLISTSATTRSSLLLLDVGPFPGACSFK